MPWSLTPVQVRAAHSFLAKVTRGKAKALEDHCAAHGIGVTAKAVLRVVLLSQRTKDAADATACLLLGPWLAGLALGAAGSTERGAHLGACAALHAPPARCTLH